MYLSSKTQPNHINSSNIEHFDIEPIEENLIKEKHQLKPIFFNCLGATIFQKKQTIIYNKNENLK